MAVAPDTVIVIGQGINRIGWQERCGLDIVHGQARRDNPGSVFQLPVATGGRASGIIGGGSHVRSGQLGKFVDKFLTGSTLGDLAAIKVDITVFSHG